MNINVDFAEAAAGRTGGKEPQRGNRGSKETSRANEGSPFHLYRCHLEPLAKIVWCLNRMLYHVDLDYKAKLAPGFRLVHGLGVVIGAGVVSEGPLTVYQGVTIGGSHGRHREDGRGGLLAAPFREQRYRVHELLHFRTDIRWGRRDCEGGSNSYEGRWAWGQDINGGCLCRL